MRAFLPINFASNWKHHFLSLPFRFIHSHIHKQHIQAIHVYCQNESIFLQNTLQDDAYWQKLKEDNDEIAKLYLEWCQVKELAHLNTGQLLDLLRDHVLPLQKKFDYIAKQLEQSHQENTLMRSRWIIEEEKRIIKISRENNVRLTKLKEKIWQGLFYRAKVHIWLNAASNVDDLTAGFLFKLVQCQAIDPQTYAQSKRNATLDDDRRLIIYDILCQAGFNQNELEKVVLEPIHKRKIKRHPGEAEIRLILWQSDRFRASCMEGLELGGALDTLFQIRTQYLLIPKVISKTVKEMISAIIEDQAFLKALAKLWALRYIAYFALSFIAFHYLAYLISPFLFLLLGETAAMAVKATLFVGVGLVPLWWYLGEHIQKIRGAISKTLTLFKRQDIVEALFTIEECELFICQNLCQTLIDIAHYDIGHLQTLVNARLSRLNQIQQKLNHYQRSERWVCKGMVDEKVKLVDNRINELKALLNQKMTQMASHVSERIGEDIDILIARVDKKRLVPVLESEQLEKLAQFVAHYGDLAAQHRFKDNTNVVQKWLDLMDVTHFACPHERTEEKTVPWGGFTIRKDVLNGWEIILTAFAKKSQIPALLRLNDFLKGQGELSRDELTSLLQQIGASVDVQQQIQQIESTIFCTLQDRPCHHARILGAQYQQMITAWYQQQQATLKEAEAAIKKIFQLARLNQDKLAEYLTQMSDDKLSDYFTALDAADIYAYSANMPSKPEQRQNLVRAYFEGYQGQNSKAYRLIRLVPEKNKTALVTELAYKRLQWILDHLEHPVSPQNPFDEVDIELFHNSRLLDVSSDFSFSNVVTTHPSFHGQWNNAMETFLGACEYACLDSGGLANKYLQKNKNIKPFLLNLCKLSSHKQTNTVESVQPYVKPKTREAIRV